MTIEKDFDSYNNDWGLFIDIDDNSQIFQKNNFNNSIVIKIERNTKNYTKYNTKHNTKQNFIFTSPLIYKYLFFELALHSFCISTLFYTIFYIL
jgi:hypothetical protein